MQPKSITPKKRIKVGIKQEERISIESLSGSLIIHYPHPTSIIPHPRPLVNKNSDNPTGGSSESEMTADHQDSRRKCADTETRGVTTEEHRDKVKRLMLCESLCLLCGLCVPKTAPPAQRPSLAAGLSRRRGWPRRRGGPGADARPGKPEQ